MNQVNRTYSTAAERLAALEVSTDIMASQVEKLEGVLSHRFERVDSDLSELSGSQSVQTRKLELIDYKVEALQESFREMKEEVLASVRAARLPQEARLSIFSKVFSGDRLKTTKTLASVALTILGILWGYLEYVGVSTLFHLK